MESIILNDDNKFFNIVSECYSSCIKNRWNKKENSIPYFEEIYDECLEMIFDYGITSLIFYGQPMSAVHALDVFLPQVLDICGFSYIYKGVIIDKMQNILFEEF